MFTCLSLFFLTSVHDNKSSTNHVTLYSKLLHNFKFFPWELYLRSNEHQQLSAQHTHQKKWKKNKFNSHDNCSYTLDDCSSTLNDCSSTLNDCLRPLNDKQNFLFFFQIWLHLSKIDNLLFFFLFCCFFLSSFIFSWSDSSWYRLWQY